MKKLNKILGMMLIAMLTLVASALTASAAIGDDYSVSGVGLGWVLIGIVIVIALIVWGLQVKSKVIKPFVPVLAILVIAGLALQFVDVAADTAASVTDDVTWDVTCTSSTADLTIDNDARTITKLIWADVDLAVINATDDSVWAGVTDDPDLNFSITPSMAIGVSSTTNQATTSCSVLTPDQAFTEDSTSYALFEEVSSGGDRNLAWTTDGTSDYENKLCTVTIGASETARLVIGLLDDGLSQREAGESHSFQISVGGVTYTMTVIISALT